MCTVCALHKEIGATMEIQEGLQAISREPGPCRL